MICPKCDIEMVDSTVYGRSWKHGTTIRRLRCIKCNGVHLQRFVMPITKDTKVKNE